MPSLTLRLPDALYERLEARAAANRRSLNSEILVCLEQAVADAPRDAQATLARIDALRERLCAPPLTDDFLAEARRGGRP